MTNNMTTSQAVQGMTDYYGLISENAEKLFNDQLEWLKRDLENTDPHRAISDIAAHLDRLRDFSARIDEAKAKVQAIRELGSVVGD